MHNLQEIFVNYIHVPTRLQIERYMQRTISVHLIVEDVLYHAAINISLGRMDGPELIQATPRGHVLPKIQIE